jgi:hypothetical protein
VPDGVAVTHVQHRPNRLLLVVVGVCAVGMTGSRTGSGGLAAMALAHGPTSPQALGLYAWWLLAWTWVVLSIARARVDLHARPGRVPLMTRRGALLTRAVDLGPAHEIVLVHVGNGATRVLLLDAAGHLVRRAPGGARLWQRPDVRRLFAGAGILVRTDHRRQTARAV